MEDDTPLTAVTAFPEHIINETVYGQESFRTLQCTIKRVCDGTLSVRLSTPLKQFLTIPNLASSSYSLFQRSSNIHL